MRLSILLLVCATILHCSLLLAVNIITDSKNCPQPRIRQRWGSLTDQQKLDFVQAVNLLKNTKEYPYPGAPKLVSVYDTFTQVHSYLSYLIGSNAVYAHGNMGFLPWHRYFIWKFENALRDVVTQYNANVKQKGGTNFMNACITLPWWDWESDQYHEKQSSIWAQGTLGSPDPGCVTTGAFANWVTSNGSCLARANSDLYRLNFAASTMMYIISYSIDSYPSLINSILGHPHNDPHNYIGGDIYPMSTMCSPDDPIFYLHHTNIDRWWTIWSDCFNYESIDPQNYVSPKHMQDKWDAVVLETTQKRTYDWDTPMPFAYNSLNLSTTPTRLSGNPTPRQMGFIGSQQKQGFDDMYYVYGPDVVVQTMQESPDFSYLCNFDITNVPLPTPSSSKRHASQDLPKDIPLFNNTEVQKVLNEIDSRFSYHTGKQKIRYLALWECSEENTQNITNKINKAWLKMNGQMESDIKTVCDFYGRNGYLALALEEDKAYFQSNETILLPFIITAVVVVLIVVVVVSFFCWREYKKTSQLLKDKTQPML